jgi:ppGpp synthetase/RelA/SpoT-type nucleotidyltranferase
VIVSYNLADIPPFTKGDIRRAGEVLKRYYNSESWLGDSATTEKQEIEQVLEAFRTVQQWRALHRYPLNTLQSLFRGLIKKHGLKDVKIGQREKRIHTIMDKLASGRFSGTLDEMQDIGGIRIVVRNMKDLRAMRNALEKSRSKQKNRKSYDYITLPKLDGYRGIHFVYKTHLPKAPPIIQGMQVELQLRTLLQHYWATAVESVDKFYGQSLKTGNGARDWKEFFQVASAAFAFMEHSPQPALYENHSAEDIALLLEKMEHETGVFRRLWVVEHALESFDMMMSTSDAAYYVLAFTRKGSEVLPTTVIHCPTEQQADYFYNLFEKLQSGFNASSENLHLFGINPASNADMKDVSVQDVVLVSTDKKQLKTLYSNYFLDVQQFIRQLEKFAAAHGHPVKRQTGKTP